MTPIIAIGAFSLCQLFLLQVLSGEVTVNPARTILISEQAVV